jgi:hypothetical protein
MLEYSKSRDLIDGLNDAFAKYDIEFVLSKEPANNYGYGENGIDQAECCCSGVITVYLLRTFFKKFYGPNRETVLYGLQVIIAHELTHRQQFISGRQPYYSEDDNSTEAYLTDHLELEAFAVEVAHELRINMMEFSHDDASMVSWRYRELVDFYADPKYAHRWPAIRQQIDDIVSNK